MDMFDEIDGIPMKWSKFGKTKMIGRDGIARQYPTLPEYVAADLAENGCTMPRVKRIEYCTKPAGVDTPAVLATVVFFDDGTKSVVKNCINDQIDTETVSVADDCFVEVADADSKERGLVYAILKRIVSSLDDDGNAVSGALGNTLRKLVDSSIDQNIIAASRKAAKKCSAEMRREAARREAFDDDADAAADADSSEKKSGNGSKEDSDSLKQLLGMFKSILKEIRDDG